MWRLPQPYSLDHSISSSSVQLSETRNNCQMPLHTVRGQQQRHQHHQSALDKTDQANDYHVQNTSTLSLIYSPIRSLVYIRPAEQKNHHPENGMLAPGSLFAFPKRNSLPSSTPHPDPPLLIHRHLLPNERTPPSSSFLLAQNIFYARIAPFQKCHCSTCERKPIAECA